ACWRCGVRRRFRIVSTESQLCERADPSFMEDCPSRVELPNPHVPSRYGSTWRRVDPGPACALTRGKAGKSALSERSGFERLSFSCWPEPDRYPALTGTRPWDIAAAL